MNLTEAPTIVMWPKTHYVFVEKTGPFQTNAPQAWQQFHSLRSSIAEHNQITGFMSLYKAAPQVYRAGVSVATDPHQLPPGVQSVEYAGGKFSRFVLTGSYADLPRASGRVMEIISATNLPLREDYFIEHYVSDPGKTPEDQLITEILVPTL